MRRPRLVRTITGGLGCALACGVAWGAQPLIEESPGGGAPVGARGAQPSFAGRRVASFSFDEPARDSVGLPRHWFRAQDDPLAGRVRPGYPIWNEARLTHGVSYLGAGAVVVPVDGGSASLRLRSGVVPVFPGADYAVRAHVRTEGTGTSRARLTARLLRDDGSPIVASESHSDLVETRGAWVSVGARVAGEWREAAFLQIDLELLQAREFEEPALGAHQTWIDDIGARAWFDEVVVSQVPSAGIRTESAMGVRRAPDAPSIRVEARDFTGESFVASLRVVDDRGEVVATRDAGRGRGRFLHSWEPGVDRYGWYRAVLEFRGGDGRPLASERVDMIALPERERAPGREREGEDRFGLVIPADALRPAEEVRSVIRTTGLGMVVLALHSSGGGIGAEDLDEWVSPLLGDGVEVAIRIDPADAMRRERGVAAGTPAGWFEEVLRRFAPSVSGWHLAPGRWNPEEAAGLEGVIASLAGRGEVYQAWEFTRPWGEEWGGSGLVLGVGSETPRRGLELIAEELAGALGGEGSTGRRVDLVVEAIGSARFGVRQAAIDLVQRTVRLVAAIDERGLTERVRLLLGRGWDVEGMPARAQPRAELAAWVNLADRMSGRRVVGRIERSGEVEGYVLAPRSRAGGRTGALVLWSNRIDGEGTFESPLAEGAVRVIDVYGNARVVEADATGAHTITFGEEPVFVEPAESEVLLLTASARLEPSMLDATRRVHEAALVVENPWSVAVAGEVEFRAPVGAVDPASWEIVPRRARVDIDPGGTARIPLTIGFSRFEESGRKELDVRMRVQAEREVRGIRFPAPFEIGLPGLRLEASYRPHEGAGGADAIIDVRVTNTGEAERAFELRAYPRGMARLRSAVTVLGAGRTAMHHFVIPGGVELLRGERVPVTLRDLDTSGTANVLVEIK